MWKNSLKILIFFVIVFLSFLLRKRDYAQIPIPGQSVDEYSYSWVGLSLIETGMPIGISGIPGYSNQASKYINPDRLYQTLSSEPLNINYPWMDHPPLLGLITGGYAYTQGARVFEDTTALFIRRPIILISTLSVALLMIYCWLNTGFLSAIVGGLVYGTAPLIVLSGRMIQAENAIIPMFLLTMIFISQYLKTKKDYWLILSAITSGVATLFKLTGVVCYLFVFLTLLNHYHRFNKQFFTDFFYYLLIALPITSLFLIYGSVYGLKNFFNIFLSNSHRFYGIGPSAIFDLIRQQRLTQHKFLPEIWIIFPWIITFVYFFKKHKDHKIIIPLIALISYLTVYLFFGSQPYGWYTFVFWPILSIIFSYFFIASLKKAQHFFLLILSLITIFGANLSRVMGIFEFQLYANYWRFGISFVILSSFIYFLIGDKTINKTLKTIISLIIFGFSIYLNLIYLNKINLDFWWQNVS
jgi:4-amino-4-deoxy-L-arabinose transferase-like glycosyltransferase